jgi:hypothetical protein
MRRQTPIFIVASPRPRVGKTLIARLLAEYLRAEGRPVMAYDLNPDGAALADYLPALTTIAGIDDIRDQMGLFDRLVVPDQFYKIIDLGHTQFEKFFTIMHDIAFAREARRQAITPVLLFVADGEQRSRQAYSILQHRFADLALVPVINEAVPVAMRYRDQFPAAFGGAPLTVPALSAVVKTLTERPGFSFADYQARTKDTTTELYEWIRKVFLKFRELELRLLLEDLKPSLQF